MARAKPRDMEEITVFGRAPMTGGQTSFGGGFGPQRPSVPGHDGEGGGGGFDPKWLKALGGMFSGFGSSGGGGGGDSGLISMMISLQQQIEDERIREELTRRKRQMSLQQPVQQPGQQQSLVAPRPSVNSAADARRRVFHNGRGF